MPLTAPPSPPWVEGLLYLMRPSLSLLLLGLTASLWREDRRQSHEREHQSRALQVTAGGWWLEVLSAGLAHSTPTGLAVTVEQTLLIGRSPECDLVFEDPSVSALHVRLTPEPGGLKVEPLCSEGRLLLDGEVLSYPIERAQGMLLRLGERVTLHLQRAPSLRL